MDNANTLQLTTHQAPALPARAFECVTALPGKVVVEMAPAPEALNGILLPPRVGGRLRPDVGTVLSCAPSRNKRGNPLPMSIKPGDGVLVRPYDGTWIDGFERGSYKAKGQVRFYGIAGAPALAQVTKGEAGDKTDTGVYEVVPWSESVVAKVVGNQILPTEGNVLIRPLVKESAVLMTKEQRTSEAVALTGEFKNKRITWTPDSLLDLEIAFDDVNAGMVMIRASQVLAVVEKDVAA